MRALFLSLLLASASLRAQPQEGLPVLQLNAGMHLVRAELAADYPSRMRGLMFRATMPVNVGMLFIFDDVGRQCMWMKNTLLPLSVAFMDENGVITNVEDMQPQ